MDGGVWYNWSLRGRISDQWASLKTSIFRCFKTVSRLFWSVYYWKCNRDPAMIPQGKESCHVGVAKYYISQHPPAPNSTVDMWRGCWTNIRPESAGLVVSWTHPVTWLMTLEGFHGSKLHSCLQVCRFRLCLGMGRCPGLLPGQLTWLFTIGKCEINDIWWNKAYTPRSSLNSKKTQINY